MSARPQTALAFANDCLKDNSNEPPMKFHCPNCQFEKRISRKYAGRKVRCPECKVKSRIEAEPTFASSESDDPTDVSDDALVPVVEVKDQVDDDEFPIEMAPVASKPSAITQQKNRRRDVQPVRERLIRDYEIKSGPLGKSVAYGCPNCGSRLTSPIDEAGGNDHCPDCHLEFVVPGEKEQAAFQRERQEDANRKAVEREMRTEATSKAVVNRVAEQQQKQEELQLDRDPMLEWYIYAVVLAGLLTFAAGQYLVSAIKTDSSYLSIMIMVLFLLGAVVNFLGMRRLRNEYVCAAVCMNNLKRVDGLQDVCRGPAAGIFHQHVMDLGKIARHDANFTQDSLITLLYSRMMSKSKMVDILSGVLVTLGLIGTIVGLISMTDGLSATLASLGDDGEAADLLSGMRSTMSGLGTAFNTTLVGAILGSVVLRILNNVYTSNVDHLVTYVASKTEVNIVPQLKRKARQEVAL